MKTKFKKGQKVMDTWNSNWGTGVVQKVLKTRMHILFPYYSSRFDGLTVYDTSHYQFLEIVK